MGRSALWREFAAGAVAGLVAGILVGGIGSRIAMRLAAIAAGPSAVGLATANGNIVGEITLGGTLGLLIFGGIFPGVAGGVLYGAVRPWLERLGPWRGLAFGTALLALAGSLVIDGDNADFFILKPAALNVATFAALFPLFGVVVVALGDRAEARLASGGPVSEGLRFIGAVLGVVVIAIGSASLAGEAVRGELDADDLVGLLLLAVIGAAVALRIWRAQEAVPWGRLSYALLLAPVLLGAARTSASVVKILTS